MNPFRKLFPNRRRGGDIDQVKNLIEQAKRTSKRVQDVATSASAGAGIRERVLSLVDKFEKETGEAAVLVAEGGMLTHPILLEQIRKQADGDLLETSVPVCFSTSMTAAVWRPLTASWRLTIEKYRAQPNTEELLTQKASALATFITNNLTIVSEMRGIIETASELIDEQVGIVRVEEAACWYRVVDDAARNHLGVQSSLFLDAVLGAVASNLALQGVAPDIIYHTAVKRLEEYARYREPLEPPGPGTMLWNAAKHVGEPLGIDGNDLFITTFGIEFSRRVRQAFLYELLTGHEVTEPEANLDLGLAYYKGQGVTQDFGEAVKWFRKAADQGHAPAQSNLGVAYDKGEGVPQDYAAAVSWYRRAADQGEAGAQYNLGLMYEGGLGVPQDYGEAVEWFRQAADQGHPSAQSELGQMYDRGAGVSQDDAEAAKWYRQAADQGNVNARFALASMYEHGRGVPQDFAEAATWLREAADQGDAESQYALGFAYAKGQGVPQDFAEAVKWYREAADQGLARAQLDLGAAYHQGEGVPQDFAEAVKWCRKAVDQGEAGAQALLGFMYYKGQGVPQDYGEAVEWFRRAADQGEARAQALLGVMYNEGQGVSQNYGEAYKWLSLAIERFPASESERRAEAVKLRDLAASKITTAEIAAAQSHPRRTIR